MTTLGYLRGVREWAYPMRTTTAFLEKGVLTPEEFVRAGDELVFRCPTWSWESGEISKQRNFLPPDKQYLITRNVPCPTRVIDMEQRLLQTQVFKGTSSSSSDGSGDNDDDDDDEEWLMSTLLQPNEVQQQQQKTDEEGDIEDEFDIVDETGEIVEPSPQPSQDDTTQPKTSTTAPAVQEMDDYADMADFEDDNVLTDEDAAAAAASSTTTTEDPITPPTATTTSTTTNTDHNEYLVKVRTYDLSITYDKYYQTPRVWMIGTSDTGQPLTAQEMMQDVMTDYAHKTVTIETHPHVAGPHASIHPCQHGKVMKRIVQNLMRAAEAENNKNKDGTTTTTAEQPTVEVYLFIFLKFVNSIIPTINYDFTMDVTASTQAAS